MEWLTGGSLHLETSPHPNFDMGIWGEKVRLSFRYIQYMGETEQRNAHSLLYMYSA